MPMGVFIYPFYYGIFWMVIWIAIIAVIVYIIVTPLRQSSSIDNEKLIKIEKDVEELKEIVKELKKKWEEIE